MILLESWAGAALTSSMLVAVPVAAVLNGVGKHLAGHDAPELVTAPPATSGSDDPDDPADPSPEIAAT